MPRRVYATDSDRVEAQRQYKAAWYERNRERERAAMRERYARKKAANVPADHEGAVVVAGA